MSFSLSEIQISSHSTLERLTLPLSIAECTRPWFAFTYTRRMFTNTGQYFSIRLVFINRHHHHHRRHTRTQLATVRLSISPGMDRNVPLFRLGSRAGDTPNFFRCVYALKSSRIYLGTRGVCNGVQVYLNRVLERVIRSRR